MKKNSLLVRLVIWIFLGRLFISPVQAQGFEILWEVDLPGWAQMPIIKDGIVYNPWGHADGTLAAIDLHTGQVLKTVDGVASATAPFIVGNRIYSYNGRMHEIDLETFQVLRTIEIPNSFYTENIPYDSETDLFFARQAQESDYKGRLSAFRRSDGQLIWSFPGDYTGGFDSHQAPIVVGDSVFFFAHNAYWEEKGYFFRLNKRTGQQVWSTPLSSSSRYGYNNPIYDQDHDLFYVSESYNSGTSKVHALRRENGGIVWTHTFNQGAIESTLSYYDNAVYVPLHNFARQDGSYAALEASSGTLIWQKPGFFHEDGWSATAVDDRYLYRVAHGTGNKIIVQDRKTGELVWSHDVGAVACCCNPVQSSGMVVLGSEEYLWGLKAGQGEAVDSDFHGLYYTGYNPGAINWQVGSPTPTAPCASPGDVDCNQVVNSQDVLKVLQNWLSSSPNPARADVNGDGKVNGVDFGHVIRDWSL